MTLYVRPPSSSDARARAQDPTTDRGSSRQQCGSLDGHARNSLASQNPPGLDNGDRPRWCRDRHRGCRRLPARKDHRTSAEGGNFLLPRYFRRVSFYAKSDVCGTCLDTSRLGGILPPAWRLLGPLAFILYMTRFQTCPRSAFFQVFSAPPTPNIGPRYVGGYEAQPAVNTAAGSALLLGQCSRDAPRYLIVGRLLSNDRYDGSGSFCDRRDGPCPRAGLHVLASTGSNRVGLAGRACLDDNRSSRVS